MRICYLNHDLRNDTGTGRFCFSLLAALKKLQPDLEYEVLTHDNFLSRTKWGLIFALPRLRKIFRKYDVIHALDGWPYGAIAALAIFGLKKKLVITTIGTGAVQPLYNFWKRPLLKWVYKKANKVVAVSNNTKREIFKIIPDLKIEVINHGVDSNKFKVKSEKLKVIEDIKPYILSVGALKKRKGYEFSIEAFAEVSKKFSDLKYVIAGKGPEYEELKDKSEKLKVADKIIFFHDLLDSELVSLYSNADLFVLMPQDVNKDIEGFGLVFLEAAAAGLPVIATKGSSAEDAVLDGKNGFLVGANDVHGAVIAVDKILTDSQLRDSCAFESIKLAQSMTWDAVARNYWSIYNFL